MLEPVFKHNSPPSVSAGAVADPAFFRSRTSLVPLLALPVNSSAAVFTAPILSAHSNPLFLRRAFMPAMFIDGPMILQQIKKLARPYFFARHGGSSWRPLHFQAFL